MNKILKTVLKVLGITVVVVLALLIIIPVFFKDKVLKAVTEIAKEYVDADVNIGDLDLSLISNFPGATVTLKDVSVVGHGEFQGDTLAKFDKFSTTVNVKSLFGGKIRVKSVLLDNPKANIIVTRAGKPNYDIAISDSSAVEEETPEEDTSSSQFELVLKKLKVNNLNVTYTDSVTDVHAYIDSLNFSLSGDLSDKETILSALLDIAKLNVRLGPIIYINDAVVNMKSDLDADLEKMKFVFKENVFKINELALGLDGYIAVPDTNVRMDLKFGAKNTDFLSVLSMIPAEYAKDLEGVKTAGTFNFEGGAKGNFNAVSFPEFWVDFNVDNARFQYPDLPKSAENINVNAFVKCPGNLDSINVNVEKFHVELGGNPVDAAVQVQTSKDDISLAGNVNLDLDLDIVNQVVPLDDMTLKGLVKAILDFKGNLSDIDNERYDRFQAQGDILMTNFRTVMTDLPPVDIHQAHLIISPEKGTLETFNMNLGKSDFSLTGKLDNIFQYVFADSTLKAKFTYKSNLLDVNDIYSYDHSSPTDQVAQNTEETATEAPEIPKNIDFMLDAAIGKILYDSLVIDDLAGKIGLKNGVASLNNLNLKMLGGKAFVNGVYDGSNQKRPKADLQLDLSEIDIQTTAKTFNTVEKMAPIASSCHGNMTAKLNFKTDLDNYLNPDLKTVNGDGRLVTSSIGIKDSKVFNLLGTAAKNESLKNPTVKNINIGFRIKDGNVEIDSTALKIADQDADFSGKIGLDQSLDMKVGMALSGTVANSLLSNAVGSDNAGLIKVIANIGGTVDDPKIKGFSTSATDALKAVAEEKIQEVKDKVSDEAKKLIADAKAQGDKLIAEAKKQKEAMIAAAKTTSEQAKKAAQEVRDKAVAAAKEEADKAVSKAGSNPLAKAAAQKAADKAIKEATQKADKALSEANAKSDSAVTEAEKQGDKLVNEAQKKADQLNDEAVKKAESIK